MLKYNWRINIIYFKIEVPKIVSQTEELLIYSLYGFSLLGYYIFLLDQHYQCPPQITFSSRISLCVWIPNTAYVHEYIHYNEYLLLLLFNQCPHA